MNLRCYKSVSDFASFEPGAVASLAQALLGRNSSEEMLVLLTGPQGPVHYSMWPLADLGTQPGIWLIGSSADLPNVAAAMVGLLDFLDGSTKWSSWKALAVTADGQRWGYVDDHIDAVGCSELHAVPDLDPLWGRLTAVAAKAACAKAHATVVLDLEPNKDDEEALATECILAQLRTRVTEGENANQGNEDEASLIGVGTVFTVSLSAAPTPDAVGVKPGRPSSAPWRDVTAIKEAEGPWVRLELLRTTEHRTEETNSEPSKEA